MRNAPVRLVIFSLKQFWIVIITAGVALLVTAVAAVPSSTQAYGDCTSYGFMATYDFLTDSCKCINGYVMGKDFMGDTQCVSGSTVCHDKYGYHSSYDSLSSSCECDSGYTFGSSYGTKQCVSLDSLCSDQLGYNSRYNSLYDKCECRYGYVIDQGRCTDGNQVCHSKHGYHSSYSDYDNSCECDSGYTLDNSSQCVEKQNNVYFRLLDVNTDNRQAIVKSEYDSRKYLITYGSGCYSSSISRYKNRQIVINLGTDFDLDTYDRIVLQDDNEVCDITHRERTYDDSLATEDASFDYISVPSSDNTVVIPPPTKDLSVVPVNEGQKKQAAPVIKKQEVKMTQTPTQSSSTTYARLIPKPTSLEASSSAQRDLPPQNPRTFWEKLVTPFKTIWARIFE